MPMCDNWADNEVNFYEVPASEDNVYAAEAPVVEYDFTASGTMSKAADENKAEFE